MESCKRVNSIASNSEDEMQPFTSSSSLVWSEMPEPKKVCSTAAEIPSIKQENSETLFLEQTCDNSKICLDEFSKSTDAAGEVTLSTARGAEEDTFNPIELVEVKQEDLDDLIDVKPELMPSKEDLPSDAALEVSHQGDMRRLSPSGLTSAGELLMVDHWLVPSGGPHQAHAGFGALDESNKRNAVVVNCLTNQKKYSCPQCDYQVDIKRSYLRHSITHKSERDKPYACACCSYQTDTKSSYLRHLVIHKDNRDKPFACSHCSYKTDAKSSYQRHILNHNTTRVKALACILCEYRTDNTTSYQRHVATHNPNRDKQLVCPTCQYRTDDSRRYQKHLTTHNKNRDKPFVCGQCPYRTDDNPRYQRHLLTHESNREKPLACPHCEFRTADVRSHQRHLVTHDSSLEKPFACTECHYKTHRKDHLRLHLRTHEGSSQSKK